MLSVEEWAEIRRLHRSERNLFKKGVASLSANRTIARRIQGTVGDRVGERYEVAGGLFE
ncbi:hypothetical protein [Rhodococcus qingshengii]|uniref:hypothetical protein n=1 Tax=Rhodococcus qingshengii TaxID=334542 RepID=UPI0036029683